MGTLKTNVKEVQFTAPGQQVGSIELTKPHTHSLMKIWLSVTYIIPGTGLLKGALDNFSLIPQFVLKKVEIFISLEVYTYVVTAC